MPTEGGARACEDALERIRREVERISERQHELNVVLREAAASSVIDDLERSYRCDASVEELARQVTGVGRR